MSQLRKTILMLAVAALSFTACRQESFKPNGLQMSSNSQGNASINAVLEQDYLHFQTIQDLQNSIELLKTRLENNNPLDLGISGFVSAEKGLQQDTTYNSDIDSEILRAILNTDNIFSVQNWIIKVDKANERVLVLRRANVNLLPNLRNNNLNSPDIMVFSTEDEVLELLSRGARGSVPESELERWGIFCRNKCGAGRNSLGTSINTKPFNTHGSVEARYIRYGIYFEFFVRNAAFENRPKGSPLDIATYSVINTYIYSYESCFRTRNNVFVNNSGPITNITNLLNDFSGITCGNGNVTNQSCGTHSFSRKSIIYGEPTGLRRYRVNTTTTQFSSINTANVNLQVQIQCGY